MESGDSQIYNQYLGGLVDGLIAAQDSPVKFDSQVGAMINAAIDRSERLIQSTELPNSIADRDIAYDIAVAEFDKSLPNDLKPYVLESAGKVIVNVLNIEIDDENVKAAQTRHRKLGDALVSRYGDKIFPDPMYINEREATPLEDEPLIKEPIYPENIILDRLQRDAARIIEKYSELSLEVEITVENLADQSKSDLEENLDGGNLDFFQEIITEMENSHYARVVVMAQDFDSLDTHRIREVMDKYLLAKAKQHINVHGDYERAKKLVETYCSDTDADLIDVINYHVLTGAIDLMSKSRETEAYELIRVNATEGSQVDMLKALAPMALRLARRACINDDKLRARDLIDTFLLNSDEKSRAIKCLALDSE
jgi:hypothetical protein